MTAPLTGLKILDFSALLPGPFATHVLSDLGADVLRVESPDRPDLVRMLPPRIAGSSATHLSLNRGKRSIALDLKQPESISAVKRLLADYDILLEGFRPGVMDRLGLGYDELKAINPRLIYVSLSGFGQTGPLRERAGHDMGYLALAGALGYGNAPERPALMGVQVGDLTGALYACVGLLAAVVQRQRTGQGDRVDVGITDVAFSLHALLAPIVLAGAPSLGPREFELTGQSLYDFYQSRDGRWFAMAALEPPFVQALLQALGIDDVKVTASFAHDDIAELKPRVAAAFATRDYADWLRVFATCEACVEPVLSLAEAAAHPQLVAREMVIEVPGPNGERLKQPGCAIKFSQPLPRPACAGVPAGAHNREVLG